MPPSDTSPRVFRNRLTQLRVDSGIYFVTWCLNDKTDELAPAERTVVAIAIRHFKDLRYRLDSYVVMNDHVHLLLQTLSGHDLSDVLHSLKGFSSREINKGRGRRGVLWEKDSYTELLTHDAAIQTRREYIYDNPRRRWGKPSHEYPWLESFN